MLILLIAIYAGAIGLAWSQFEDDEIKPEIGSALTCEKVDNYVVCTERWK